MRHEEKERRRLAAEDAWAEPHPEDPGSRGEPATFVGREAALRADQEDRVGNLPQGREHRLAALFVGHHDPRSRGEPLEPGLEVDRTADPRHGKTPALLGGFDGDGAQPVAPAGPHDGAPGEHEIDGTDAEFDGFLDEPVEPVRSDRGDRETRPRGRLGRAQTLDDPGPSPASVETRQPAPPLTALGVEQPHRCSGGEAQDVAELMRALRVELDLKIRGERPFEVETRRPAEVRHRFAFPHPDARNGPMRGQGSEVAVADQQLGWVGRLPPRLRDFGMLARWDRPIGTWLLLLPCWWGQALAPGLPDLRLAFLFAIGAIAMRGAGCTINDLFDREFDRKVARTANRPLAAGRLGVFEALAFAALQSFVGLVVLVQLPLPAILVGSASVPLIVVYPLMKRVTWWPQAVLGITFNWGVLVGYVAVTGKADLAMVLLYLAAVAWTLGYDTIYAHQDKEDDRLVGVRSTALLLGERTLPWLIGFYGTMVVLLAAAALVAGKGPGFWLLLPLVVWTLVRQLRGLDLDDPRDCIRRFRMNRATGLAVTAALVAGGLDLGTAGLEPR